MSDSDGQKQKSIIVDKSDSFGADMSVRITPQDEFAHYSDDDLRGMLETMTNRDVEVDEHPELEPRYETYGAGCEIHKQEIIDELKRRALQH